LEGASCLRPFLATNAGFAPACDFFVSFWPAMAFDVFLADFFAVLFVRF
jgi:hypothetical protein